MSNYHSFAVYYDILTQNVPYGKRGEYFNALIKAHNPNGNILVDLGCGTGTLCEIMAGYGYDVIGIDNSCEMLNVAMDKRYDSGSDILYLCQEMDNMDLYGTMDICICALDSINHITDKQQLARVFEKVSLFLHPQGVFIFDANTIHKHTNILANNTYVYDYDNVYCVWQNTLQQDNIVEICLDLFCKNDDDNSYSRQCECFLERAYSHDEIVQALANTNLSIVNVYAEDSLDPPTDDSQRTIYVLKSTKKL